MTDKKIKILFSAPADFLIEYFDYYIKKYDVHFIEIWKLSDIPLITEHYDVWIPNPGQNFIINKSVVEKFSSLKIISTPSTGTNHINLDDCLDKSIKVYGLMDQREGLNEISASAEFTFLKILSSLRNLRASWDEVNHGRWRDNENELRGREVKEMTYGLIGMGRIGNNLVRYLGAFGAKNIFFYDNQVDSDNLKKAKFLRLREIFENCDVVVICVALNKQTKKMIDGTLLSKLKENAHLINTSRGEIINETDLVSFLHTREDIRFSADVLSGEVENRSLNQELLSLHYKKRIDITPHIAGATVGSQKKAAILAFDMVQHHV